MEVVARYLPFGSRVICEISCLWEVTMVGPCEGFSLTSRMYTSVFCKPIVASTCVDGSDETASSPAQQLHNNNNEKRKRSRRKV